MKKRSKRAAGVLAGVSICTLVLACSSSHPAGTSPADAATELTPAGATATVDAGLVGCANLQEGCFTYSGSYEAPAVTATCAASGGAATGAADAHCNGVPPQAVSPAACGVLDAGASGDDAGATDDAGPAEDAGAPPAPGQCGENSDEYGATMYGTSGKDDDCKYDVSYTASPICENDGTYFVVKADYLTNGAPLVGACTLAELCLNDSHTEPTVSNRPPFGQQEVVEGPPGTYTIGPVQFDAPGKWTVRFHFNELCCDALDDSPHGHAAFFVNVP